MRNKRDYSSIVVSFFSALVLFLSANLLYAQTGCCSHHGGVKGCATTGFQLCQDGSSSPTCKCNGLTSSTTKSTTVKKTTKTVTPAKTTTKKASKTITPSTTTKKATKTVTPSTATKSSTSTTAIPVSTSASTKGCCARHGGVARCNKKTGFQICKDGSSSTTCRCN